MNMKDKNPCLPGPFRGRFLPRSLDMPVSQVLKLPMCLAILAPKATWLSPPDCEPAWGPGRCCFPRADALFTLGQSLQRSPACAVISHRFLPRRRGSAFLRLEQQLSLRRRLGRGQAAARAGPLAGVARVASLGLRRGRALGLRFLQRGGVHSRAAARPSRPEDEVGAGPVPGLDCPAWRPEPGSMQFFSTFHSSSEDFLTSERRGCVVTTEQRS